jgi:hypothetical protein
MLLQPVSANRHMSSRGHGVVRYRRGIGGPSCGRERIKEQGSLEGMDAVYPQHQAFVLTACPAYDSSGYFVARNQILRVGLSFSNDAIYRNLDHRFPSTRLVVSPFRALRRTNQIGYRDRLNTFDACDFFHSPQHSREVLFRIACQLL